MIGRRAGDTNGLPHERGYFRRLGQDLPANDEEAGNSWEWDEECGACDTEGDRLTPAQRDRRQRLPRLPKACCRSV